MEAKFDRAEWWSTVSTLLDHGQALTEVARTELPFAFESSSLIALSLIMAISRFKPAPIYIFDEIDAALDLNMTSNL